MPCVYNSLPARHSPVLYHNDLCNVTISSPSESPNIVVSENIWVNPKFENGHPDRGRCMRLGWYELVILGIFRPINRRISERVQDRTKVAIDH